LFLFICDIAQGTRTDGIEQDFFDRLTKITVSIQESQRHGVGTASSPQKIVLLRHTATKPSRPFFESTQRKQNPLSKKHCNSVALSVRLSID